MTNPALPTAQQADTLLTFIERVGLPWVLVFVLLALVSALVIGFFKLIMPELRSISLSLRDTTNSNVRLAEEVHRGNTPPMGTPVPAALRKDPP